MKIVPGRGNGPDWIVRTMIYPSTKKNLTKILSNVNFFVARNSNADALPVVSRCQNILPVTGLVIQPLTTDSASSSWEFQS